MLGARICRIPPADASNGVLSPDGRVLATISASDAGCVSVWIVNDLVDGASSGKRAFVPRDLAAKFAIRLRARLSCMCFVRGASGPLLATADDSGGVQLWDVDTCVRPWRACRFARLTRRPQRTRRVHHGLRARQ